MTIKFFMMEIDGRDCEMFEFFRKTANGLPDERTIELVYDEIKCRYPAEYEEFKTSLDKHLQEKPLPAPKPEKPKKAPQAKAKSKSKSKAKAKTITKTIKTLGKKKK